MKKKFSVVYNAGAKANRVLNNNFEYTVLERSMLTEYESVPQQEEENAEMFFDPSYMQAQLDLELATDPAGWMVNIQKLKSKLGIVESSSKFDNVIEGYGTLASRLAQGARTIGGVLSGAGKAVANKARSYVPQNTLPADSSKFKQVMHNTKRYGTGVKNAYGDAMNKITPVAKGMNKVSDLMGGDPRSGATSNLTGSRKIKPGESALADAISQFHKNPSKLMSNPQFLQWSKTASPQQKKDFVDIMAQLTHPSNKT